MSGGAFDYKQFHIQQIAFDIEQEVRDSGRKKTKEELEEEVRWYGRTPEYYQKYPEELNQYAYPEDILEEFRKAEYTLKKAYIYTQRIDWLLSGDDGEDSFRERLTEELNNLENEFTKIKK